MTEEGASGNNLEGAFAVFEQANDPATPFTAREVADELDCARRTAFDKLEELAERGVLKTKKTGAGGRVWWRPMTPTASDASEGLPMRTEAADANEGRPTTAGDASEANRDVETHGGSGGDAPTDRERTLAALVESTSDLLQTETHQEIGEEVVDTIVGALGLTEALVYRLETSENRLVPLSHSLPDETPLDQLPVLRAGEESPVWTSFVDGRSIVADASDVGVSDHGSSERVLVVPLGDHGVFAVGVPGDGPMDIDRRTLLELVGATAEAAFDRVESQANIRERDAILQEQNQHLQRLNQINSIIRDIDQALVSASTRTEVQRVVCERLSESERFRFAWIGESDDVGVVPVAHSGAGRGYLDSVPLTESDEPAAVAARTGEVIVVSNVADDLRTAAWRTEAFSREFQSVISVPLTDGEMTDGVLTVYADRPDVFGEMEQSVFAELGETIADSIASVETKRALLGDQLIELEFLLGDGSTSFLSRIASEIECDVAFEGVIPLADGRSRVFFTASDVESDAVHDVLDRSVAVESNELVATGEDGHLFEVVLTGENLALSLIENGGSLTELRVADDEIRVVVDLPASADVREFIAEFQQTYTGAEFVARRESGRIAQTAQGFRAELTDQLTERQLEVLKTAYYSGFFDSPRRSTGSDVGDVLGVSQPTVTEHLRSAQSTLLGRLFADESAVNR